MKGKSAVTSLGEKFGRLTVVSVDTSNLGWAKVRAACDCGGTWEGQITPLRSGKTLSCGCLAPHLKSGLNRTHGKSSTPEYRTWKAMKRRCYSPTSPDYPLYGGAGVRVCSRWLESFEAFLVDMGERPDPSMSIDRWPVSNGDYEPGNCRWATKIEQGRNTVRVHHYEYKGRSLTLGEWCGILGLHYYTTKGRLADGWTVERAFEHPLRNVKQGLKYDHEGKSMTLAEWSRHLGINATTLNYRIKSGWPLSAVFGPLVRHHSG